MIRLFFLLLFVLPIVLPAQQYKILGRVVDFKTNDPLPFVNVIYGEKKGVITSLDGKFSFEVDGIKFPLKVKFSYVGYRDTVLNFRVPHDYTVEVKLKSQSFVLQEVTVFPGENPANKIMKKVVENRKKNDPEKGFKAFYYKSYNKMYFTGVKKDKIVVSGDTLFYVDTSSVFDTSKAAKFLKKQYLFLLETVSERYFEKPDKNYEKVLISRVSGFTVPTFFVLATQFQSFSFYKSQVNLLDKKYVSPISPSGWKKYFFQLIDTSYGGNGDTIFIIKFKPHIGKKFDGLKGVIYITTDGYAIKNIMAEPVEQGNFYIKINQNYEKYKGAWMPMQLNSKMIFNGILLDSNYVLAGVDKTYLFDVIPNGKPDTLKPKFGVLDVNRTAFKNAENRIEKYRVVPLTSMDSATYHIIDSLGKAENLNQKYLFMKYILTGAIPVGPVNIKLNKLMSYNLYEKFRLGIGLETNNSVSQVWSIGGYYAYSFGIKKHNYGGNLRIFLDKSSGVVFNAGYKNDMTETGGYNFYGYKSTFASTERYRLFYLKKMDYVESKFAGLDFRVRHFWGNVYFETGIRTSENIYNYGKFDVSNGFNYNEVGIKLKLAIGEQVMKTVDGSVSLGTKYPVLYFNYKRGLSINGSGLRYEKYEFMWKKDFDLGLKGILRTSITAGKVSGDVPLSLMYDMHGSYYKDHLFVSNTFQTMDLCSFYADKFVAGHFYYDLKHLLIKTKYFIPNFILAYSVGYGTMENKLLNYGFEYNMPDKIYSETGLIINDIIRSQYAGVGLGVFYKIGSYSSSELRDNFYFKLSLILHLD